jgi:hypothetical protein
MSDYMKRTGRFEFKRDPENEMLIGPAGCHYENERQAMYFDQLGFCGCGNPADQHVFVAKCLEAFDREKTGWEPGTGLDKIAALVIENPEEAAYFIAYALDKVDLIEHGGSVGGSWLTDRGKQFLEIGPMTEEDDDE